MATKVLSKGEASEKNIWLFATGNFAGNLLFMVVGMYIMYYYTNILGVSAAVAGTIFMVARLIDAATDPLMGMFVDRTNTKRWGKYRPFIIFGAPFLGIALVMLFTTPNLSLSGKILYAYVSYIFYSLTWTVVQIPRQALPLIFSNSTDRRARIQAVVQMFGAVAVMAAQSWVIPMLDFFGGQENALAWNKVIVIYAIVATIIFLVSVRSLRNLDVYDPNAVKQANKSQVSIKESLKVVLKNRALLCVLFAYGTDMFANQIGNSLRIYFFKYNMGGRMDLMSYLGYAGFISALIMLCGLAPYVRKMGMRKGIFIIEAISILFSGLLLFAAPLRNVALVMVSFIGNAFLFTISNTLSRAAVLDSANYSETHTGVRCNALISSTFTFVNKCCQAVSVFAAGHILTATGYNAQLTQQADGTLQAILYLMTLVPIVAYVCSLIGMYFYPLTRQGEIEMEQKIREIRSQRTVAV